MKNAMDDLVMLLPGITGSVLERNGTTLWNASYATILRTIAGGGKNLKSLMLDHDHMQADFAPDGVTAPALIEDANLVPGLVKIDGYSKLPQAIEEAFDIYPCGMDDEEAGNFMNFPTIGGGTSAPRRAG